MRRLTGCKWRLFERRIRRRFGEYRVREKQKPENRLLTTAEAARFLGMSPNTLRRWHDEGKVKAYRLAGRGDRRFEKKELESLLKDMRQEGGSK